MEPDNHVRNPEQRSIVPEHNEYTSAHGIILNFFILQLTIMLTP